MIGRGAARRSTAITVACLIVFAAVLLLPVGVAVAIAVAMVPVVRAVS